jgi:PsbP
MSTSQPDKICRDYVTFEFLQKSARFTRHVLAAATVANGKLILFTIGAKEGKRWDKMKDKLAQSVKTFKAFTVY